MKRWAFAAAIAVSVTAAFPAVAGAVSPGTQGQPNASCQSFFSDGSLIPSGFNQPGFIHATKVYAGAQSVNSNNPNSVSQYDVACLQANSRLSR